MVILLYGPDNFRSKKKLKEIIEQYKKVNKKGLSLIFLDAQETNFSQFKNELQQTSLFSEKKLIVLTDVFSNQQFKEDLLENWKMINASDSIVVIFGEGKVASNDRLLKIAAKEGKNQEFELLEGDKLKKWIKAEVAALKGDIDPEALDRLAEFSGNDLWRLENEIKKLVSFKGRERIEAKDISLLVKPKIDADIFKTIDAIAQKDRKRALVLINRHLEKGDNALYLLSMVTYQFRNLLLVKDLMEKNYPYYAIAQATSMKPFVLRKSYQLAGEFSMAELKKIYRNIFQADLDIKTGKIKPEMVFDLLLTEF